MENLDKYAKEFDKRYTDYSDEKYESIKSSILVYSDKNIASTIDDPKFGEIMQIISPIIRIKNYKSKIPFPEDLAKVGKLIYRLVSSNCDSGSLNGEVKKVFEEFVDETKGFQLPTVSAIFHFSYPHLFPIVDRNVESACELMKDRHKDSFQELVAPKIPAPATSPQNKIEKYKGFIKFINRIRNLQKQEYDLELNYREIDKALMVYGVDRYRELVESNENSNNGN